MTTHIIYHGNCYDGFGAAWAAWKVHGLNAIYHPAKYGEEPPALDKDANVVIVDFSYPRAKLEAFAATVNSLRVLDHHKTAEEDLRGFPGAVFDMNHSGAYLSWIFFHPQAEIPRLIRYVEDRDLWRFQLQDSKAISAWLQSHGYDFEVWSKLAEALDQDYLRCAAEGGAILRAKEQMVKQMADNAVVRDVGGYQVPVANATCYFSEVGEELCVRNPDAAFAAYYLDRKDGKRQWGLRSRNGFDVSVVAKQMGGGGHKAAAGFVESLS